MNRISKIRMALTLVMLLFVLYTAGGVATMIYSRQKTAQMADYVARLDLDRMVLLADDLMGTSQDTTGVLDSLRASEPNVDLQMDLQYNPKRPTERGNTTYQRQGESWLCYYTPLRHPHWTLSLSAPDKIIYQEVYKVRRGLIFNLILGILILLFICYRLFQRIEQYETVAAQKATLQGELHIAAGIQQGMLPKVYPPFPDLPQLDVYGMVKPAKEVGGDLFDYFLRNDRLFFCIGDVSGKGVPASLFMAVVRSLFRNITLHQDDPARIAGALNTALSEGNEHNMFCTLFLGMLDIKTGHLSYCNCGHNAPVIRRLRPDGSHDVHYAHIKTNMAIGVWPEFPYQAEETDLRPGEALFLYTDGVTEAESQTKELYGEQRLLEALNKTREQNLHSAKALVDAIYADVERFAEPDYQSDDITMVVVEYKSLEFSV